MSNHALITLADALRHRRSSVGTRWRRLSVGQQAMLVLAHLRKSETYPISAPGTASARPRCSATSRRRSRSSPLAPTLQTAMATIVCKAFVILDGTLLRIDRVGMGSGRDRLYYSGKHKCHGMNVQVISDAAGRLVWASPALPGARHDMGAARDHGILDALGQACVKVIVDNGYRGAGFEVPQRRRPADPRPGSVDGSRPTRRRSTPPTPANADPVNARTPSSRPGASCARSAAAHAG